MPVFTWIRPCDEAAIDRMDELGTSKSETFLWRFANDAVAKVLQSRQQVLSRSGFYRNVQAIHEPPARRIRCCLGVLVPQLRAQEHLDMSLCLNRPAHQATRHRRPAGARYESWDNGLKWTLATTHLIRVALFQREAVRAVLQTDPRLGN